MYAFSVRACGWGSSTASMIATLNSLILASTFSLGSGFFAAVTVFLAGSSSVEAVDASKAAVPAVKVSSKSDEGSVFGGMASSAIDLK